MMRTTQLLNGAECQSKTYIITIHVYIHIQYLCRSEMSEWYANRVLFFQNPGAQLIDNPHCFLCRAGYGEPLSVSSPKEACVLRGDPC